MIQIDLIFWNVCADYLFLRNCCHILNRAHSVHLSYTTQYQLYLYLILYLCSVPYPQKDFLVQMVYRLGTAHMKLGQILIQIFQNYTNQKF